MLTPSVATKQVHFQNLDAFAASLEPRARRAFLDAIEAIKDGAKLSALEAAISAGALWQVQEALNLPALADALAPLRDVILDAVRGGGEIAMADVGIGISFDITDERALRYVQQHAGALIREVSVETIRGVNKLIELEFTQGVSPQVMARRIRERVGLTAYQQQIVANYEATLRAAVRGEATWAEVNAYRLNPIRGAGGLVEARIDAAVAQYRQRLLNLRAETIARTETMSAAASGQREGWRQLEARGALPPTVMREWMAESDACPICAPLDGERAPLEGMFPGGYDQPPLHPSCRCTTALVGL